MKRYIFLISLAALLAACTEKILGHYYTVIRCSTTARSISSWKKRIDQPKKQISEKCFEQAWRLGLNIIAHSRNIFYNLR